MTLELDPSEPTPAVASPSPNLKRSKADSNTSSIASSQEDDSPSIQNPSITPSNQEQEHHLSEAELRAQYPPDDARAMSPRRSSAETNQMVINARKAIDAYVYLPSLWKVCGGGGHITDTRSGRHTKHAQDLQISLDQIATRINCVKSDTEKLDRNNQELQNYIGGLTRSISSTSLGSEKSKKKK